MKALNKIPSSLRFKYGCYQFFDHFLTRKRFFKWSKKSRTRFYKKLEEVLKQNGEGKLIPVDRVKSISKKDFFKNYVKKGIPLVIEGYAKDWDCVKKWSLEYFKELHGDDKIVFMESGGYLRDYEESTLGEVIDDIRGGKGKYYRFYPLLKRHPEHILDFDYEWLREHRDGYNVGEAFHTFISGQGGFTPIHNAGAENLFIQVYGEKKWVLYPTEATCVIDPSPSYSFYRSAPVRYNNRDFNPFELNYEDYPLYRYLNGYSVHLKPGDVFYNPAYMWHSVKNPTDSIGVGYRFFTPFKTFARTPLYFFLDLFAFKAPIWKTWRNFDDINLFHLMESGKLKELAKKKGVQKITETVS
ncbi:MAG: cupin-like domain-containing protein [Flavobacteriales bacterium]|nr:cupin-like domain-containing protein [Flavobacteriales bacterium]